ncbi:MAG: ABC transporter substrate-binding protein [Flavobacteriales bacterium]
MICKDQLNRELTFLKSPIRIVSLVPSQTELLVDLGLEEKLVGITKFCVHPSHLKKNKVIVGGTKKVSYSKIAALSPDIIICNKEENTQEMVAQLEKIAPVWISDIYTIKDNLQMIIKLGQLFKVKAKAEEICDIIKSEQQKFSSFIKNKPTKKAAYLIWKNPYMLAGTNTFINELLMLNNFKNIAASNSRYPEIKISDLQKADVVLLSSEPFPFKIKDVQNLKKILNKEVFLVDGEYFSWYGSRLQKAFSYFTMFH